MKLSNTLVATAILSELLGGTSAFQANRFHRTRQQFSSLSVASQDIEQSKKTEDEDDHAVPYVVARGDGSTGGGGLPMPKQLVEEGEDDGLVRPKVGAEMPEG